MLIAIIGRPNVGKSTLFNLLVKENRAIVGPERGITRDRIHGRWRLDEEHIADIVDTGGYDSEAMGAGSIAEAMREQTLLALQEADLILFLLDARGGITRDDLELARIIREAKADVIYVANKVDDPNMAAFSAQLYELGMEHFIEISALNRRISELVQAVLARIEKTENRDEQDANGVRVSIIGRPNVGKSMMINRLTGSERAIVSPIPGTTRDYVDIALTRDGKNYILVDTAGIRRRSHIDEKIEKVSVMRSIQNVQRSNVCLCMMDATEPLTDQDRTLLNIIMDHGRACAIVMNKSDLINAAQKKEIKDRIEIFLRYVPDISIIYTSGLKGMNVQKLFPLIDELHEKSSRQFQTAALNSTLQEIVEKNPPPAPRGRRIKLFYITQTGTQPPVFRIVSNHPEHIPESYQRYLTSSLKKALELNGIPIKINLVGRSQANR